IGGFVDIGELVAATQIGARFAMSLAWVIPLSVIGIILYAEMSGRVAAVSQRPVFDVIRHRMGPSLALVNLLASFLVTLLTLAAEIGGVAIAVQLATSINYLLWIPIVGFLVWFVIWKLNFELMENLFGILGLTLFAALVTVMRVHPHWAPIAHQVLHPAIPSTEGPAMYWYFAVAMFGAGIMPYEVFFFSSGAIEDGWTAKDLMIERINVYLGFPIGGLLTLTLMLGASLVLGPRNIQVSDLSTAALPTMLVVGKLGLATLLLGFFACTFGAALETSTSCGYTVAQFFGWQWGKFVRPTKDGRFHLVMLLSIAFGSILVLTTIDPVKLTEFVIVLSAAALPLTYFPVLIVANDRAYMKDKVNSSLTNFIATVYLFVVVVAGLAAIPLMIITKGGG
ncbi:MAG: NRAMP family divalent metal transporter, partial [Actinomycetota bacterium]|nr:divalent metal cation transporter [Actinomycetota bacterium]